MLTPQFALHCVYGRFIVFYVVSWELLSNLSKTWNKNNWSIRVLLTLRSYWSKWNYLTEKGQRHPKCQGKRFQRYTALCACMRMGSQNFQPPPKFPLPEFPPGISTPGNFTPYVHKVVCDYFHM